MIKPPTGPNSEFVVAPLTARTDYVETVYHLPPRLAAAIVLSAEATHAAMVTAARLDDHNGVQIASRAYLGSWSGIGATFAMCNDPLGISHLRIYQAARYTLERTIRENQELEERLDRDPEFAKQYAERVAGAEMEKALEAMMKNHPAA